MGNVPGKEERVDERRGTLNQMTVREILNPSVSHKKKRSSKEKEVLKEQTTKDLIIRHEENVDGGYLAPYGTYTTNLDYSTPTVRSFITQRRIAPFYLPLEEFDEEMAKDDAKLLDFLLRELKLHSPLSMETFEENDTVILDPNSKNYQKHLQAKEFERKLYEKQINWQLDAINRFTREQKLCYTNGFKKPNIPSKDYLVKLYKTAKECPICFLYYPDNFNYTRCCIQPICSECFVQIKRLDPHPPHDAENEAAPSTSSTALPKDLISEPAKCPFCGTPDFGVTYTPPKIRTGLFGMAPNDYIETGSQEVLSEQEGQTPKNVPTKRRSSSSASHPSVVTTDMIRPDWERKLNNARMKLARRSAAATAIHASSLLMDENGEGAARARRNTNENLEQRMIDEALRLSLLEEEERKARQKK